MRTEEQIRVGLLLSMQQPKDEERMNLSIIDALEWGEWSPRPDIKMELLDLVKHQRGTIQLYQVTDMDPFPHTEHPCVYVLWLTCPDDCCKAMSYPTGEGPARYLLEGLRLEALAVHGQTA